MAGEAKKWFGDNAVKLLIDTPYLAWRSHHALGPLSHRGRRTEVLFGVMREIQNLRRRFDPCRMSFCFDYPPLKRKEIFPDYKKRKPTTTEEMQNILDVQKQIRRLYKKDLPALGMANTFCQEGYEADDVIASLAWGLFDNEEAVIVSADQDLYQLLRNNPHVSIYHPAKGIRLTVRDFVRDYKVYPYNWRHVKAMAGCVSDSVPGIPGVGEKTAIKWILSQLKTTSAAWKKIDEGGSIIERNLRLVTLPYPGVNRFIWAKEIGDDGRKKWKDVCVKYRFKSLM